MGAKTLLTIEQFEQLPVIEGISYELDEGELIEVASPILRHNLIRDKLARSVAFFLGDGVGQAIVVVEQSFRLAPDTVRIPDVAVIASSQLPLRDLDSSIQSFGPALAVEITSPSNTFNELTRKTRQYFQAGAQAVWIVVPPAQEIHVYQSNAHPRILCAGDILDEPDLLQGFSLPVTDLFRV